MQQSRQDLVWYEQGTASVEGSEWILNIFRGKFIGLDCYLGMIIGVENWVMWKEEFQMQSGLFMLLEKCH